MSQHHAVLPIYKQEDFLSVVGITPHADRKSVQGPQNSSFRGIELTGQGCGTSRYFEALG